MKRNFLWCLALTSLVAITSCTQDETVDEPTPQSQAIGFSSFLDMATRADYNTIIDMNNSSLNAFQVWAYEKYPNGSDGYTGGLILKNASIVKEGSEWKFQTASQQAYWRPNSNYTFFAVAPARYVTLTEGNLITVQSDAENPTNIGIAFDNRIGIVDLVAAINNDYATTPWTPGSDATAHMNFCHLLSRVHFAFRNAMEDGSSLQISNVTITNSPRKGIASVSKESGKTVASWIASQGGAADETVANLAFAGATKALGDTPENTFEDLSDFYIKKGYIAETQPLLIIPVNTITLNVSFTIKHKKGNLITTYPKSVNITMPADGWQSGYCYQLTATLTTKNVPNNQWEPIMFDATVTDWIENGETTITVPDATE